MVDLKLDIPGSFYNEEVCSGFTVTKERKELWAVELDLLAELDRVCKKHGLRYFADGGTALGAVRHQGYIPWDDDIDISMFREDYNRLCSVAAEEFCKPYFFQTEHSDPGSMRDHAQLRNSATAAILNTELELKLPFNQGIFIDIFPIDNIPEDETELKAFLREVRLNRTAARIYARFTTRYRKCRLSSKELLFRAGHALLGNSDSNPFYDRYEKVLQKYDSEPSDCVSLVYFLTDSDAFIWEKAWYEDVIYMPFEMLDIPVCSGYDEYLTRHYGDWRTPKQAGALHGGLIFDTERPYTEYLE